MYFHICGLVNSRLGLTSTLGKARPVACVFLFVFVFVFLCWDVYWQGTFDSKNLYFHLYVFCICGWLKSRLGLSSILGKARPGLLCVFCVYLFLNLFVFRICGWLKSKLGLSSTLGKARPGLPCVFLFVFVFVFVITFICIFVFAGGWSLDWDYLVLWARPDQACRALKHQLSQTLPLLKPIIIIVKIIIRMINTIIIIAIIIIIQIIRVLVSLPTSIVMILETLRDALWNQLSHGNLTDTWFSLLKKSQCSNFCIAPEFWPGVTSFQGIIAFSALLLSSA